MDDRSFGVNGSCVRDTVGLDATMVEPFSVAFTDSSDVEFDDLHEKVGMRHQRVCDLLSFSETNR